MKGVNAQDLRRRVNSHLYEIHDCGRTVDRDLKESHHPKRSSHLYRVSVEPTLLSGAAPVILAAFAMATATTLAAITPTMGRNRPREGRARAGVAALGTVVPVPIGAARRGGVWSGGDTARGLPVPIPLIGRATLTRRRRRNSGRFAEW